MASKATTKARNTKQKFHNPNQKLRGMNQIIYPSSAPLGWWNMLTAEVDNGKLKYCVCSPLHDSDKISLEDVQKHPQRYAPTMIGQNKEEHFHLSVEFTNPQYIYGATKYLQSINNGTYAEPRLDLKGTIRYMAHLDENPREKALYAPDQIIAYGIDISGFITEKDNNMTSAEAFEKARQLIIKYDITEQCDFDDLLYDVIKDIDLIITVQKNQNLRSRIYGYINSRRNKAKYSDIAI